MNPKLPDQLKVCGIPFKVNVKLALEMPDSLGQCHPDDLAIDIREGQLPLIERDTVLHEIFHAIRAAQGREFGGKVEEDYVRSLATGLVGVIHANPEFAKWLTHPVPNEPSRPP